MANKYDASVRHPQIPVAELLWKTGHQNHQFLFLFTSHEKVDYASSQLMSISFTPLKTLQSTMHYH